MREKEVSQPAARAAPVFAIMLRHNGKEQTTDLPLSSPAIEVLALEAMSRDLDVAGLVGQVLAVAMNKDMIPRYCADNVLAQPKTAPAPLLIPCPAEELVQHNGDVGRENLGRENLEVIITATIGIFVGA